MSLLRYALSSHEAFNRCLATAYLLAGIACMSTVTWKIHKLFP